MTNPNQLLEPFDETFQQPNIHHRVEEAIW